MRFLLVAALVVSSLSFAQTSAGTKERKAPTSSVTFGDGDTVEGTTTGPDLGMIVAPPKGNHASMIKVRDNFTDKLRASVNELR